MISPTSRQPPPDQPNPSNSEASPEAGTPSNDSGTELAPDTLYSLLPPVREYATEQCSAAELASVRSRLRHWLSDLARQGLPQHRLRLQPELQHAWSLLLRVRQDGEPAQALALTVALQGEWSSHQLAPEFLALIEWALTEHPQGTHRLLLSQAHYLMACLAQLRCEPDRAAAHADLALASAPDKASQALALSIGCWVDQERGAAPDSVQPRLSQALALARESNDVRAQALIVRLQAAHEAYHLANPATAEPLLRESIRLFARVGDATQVSFRQTELAWCRAQTGHPDEALNLLQQVASQDAVGNRQPIMIYMLTVLGQVQLQSRQPQAAAQSRQQAVQLALQTDWLGLVPAALLPLPQAWMGCGMAQPAALLHGHLMASWRDALGRFNRVQMRSNRRTHLLLVQRFGSRRCARLLHQGSELSRDDALQLVREPAARET